MKLIRFTLARTESYGLLINSSAILDLPKLYKAAKQLIPPNLDTLISAGTHGLNAVNKVLHNSTEADRKEAVVNANEVKVLAPIAAPPKIICLGLNYQDHAAEQKAQLPSEPIIFMKPHTAVIGPDQAIVKPAFVKQLDYEAELAVIIGKAGKYIAIDDAKDHIFGYTCFNDVSARDIQFKDKQWTRGKSFDTFAPVGPYITTAQQIGDPANLWIRTRVNGELRQDSSTRNMVFSVYEIVHELSRVMTLEPCDIIATGTPAGVAFAMKPEQKFLSSGDVVEIEIENIGVLRNPVVESGAT